jgi:hypothetical protein
LAGALIVMALHTKASWKRKDSKNAMGFAGCGAGRRDSCVRRVDDNRGTYETVGRIEKPGDEGCFSFPLRPMFSPNKMSTPHTFPHPGHPLTSVFCMRRLKVLLVDDDDGARLLYCYMLAAAGYKVNAVRKCSRSVRRNTGKSPRRDCDRHRNAGSQRFGFNRGCQVE